MKTPLKPVTIVVGSFFFLLLGLGSLWLYLRAQPETEDQRIERMRAEGNAMEDEMARDPVYGSKR